MSLFLYTVIRDCVLFPVSCSIYGLANIIQMQFGGFENSHPSLFMFLPRVAP